MYGDKVEINKDSIRDKIKACWLGKNIGGTIGAPYENVKELLDIKGFTSEKGKIIPNDDLDLQLAWLVALERKGPYDLNANVLAEYWTDLIIPHWNEYGVAKGNLRNGMFAGASGELNNEKWKHSNGGWIRSEIWACVAPGFPQIAIRYAQMDACVDHGAGEGTYAEMFTAAMESIAFRKNDVREIIEEALEYIPKDCRVRKSVEYVIEAYDNKTDWKDVRLKLIEMDKDIGYFMAPANVGYVILGLLYGEGDFKKSMLYTINCGDDTDCTGATIGALMGILKGTKGLPSDWVEHIGEDILTISLDASFVYFPKNINDLTDRVFKMMPVVLKANRVDVDFTEQETDLSIAEKYEKWCDTKDVLTKRSPYTYDGVNFSNGCCRIEFDKEPVIAPGETITGEIKFAVFFEMTYTYRLRMLLPEGWEGDIAHSILLGEGYVTHYNETIRHKSVKFSIKAGDNVEGLTRIPIEVTSPGRPTCFYIPVIIQGK